MSAHRFRSPEDYTQELFRTWQICQSDFTPYNTYMDTKTFPLIFRSAKAIKAIRAQSYKLDCVNDSEHIINYDKTMQAVSNAFDYILPDKTNLKKKQKKPGKILR